MFRYIESKHQRTAYREYCESKIICTQKHLKDYFTFSFKLIGSGESRLMTVNGNNKKVDLDYNLILQRDKKQLIDDPKKIKHLFMDAFKNACGYKAKVSDSTQVITCFIGQLEDYDFSFDVAIMVEANDGFLYKIVNIKEKNTCRYIWNKVPESRNFEHKFLFLKRNGYWEQIKELYLRKKNINLSKQTSKQSFSILIETVNEIIQTNHIII